MAQQITIPTFTSESFEKFFEEVKLKFELQEKAQIFEEIKAALKSQAAQKFAGENIPLTAEDIDSIAERLDIDFNELAAKEGREMLAEFDATLEGICATFDEELNLITLSSHDFEEKIQLTMFGPQTLFYAKFITEDNLYPEGEYIFCILSSSVVANLNALYARENECIYKEVEL